jgi:hypothetical protein
METMEELKARLNRVIAQKDRYGEALGSILDAIRHGRYNGLFESGYRYEEKDKTECPQGMKYKDIRWRGCRKVLSCPTCRCPMTFEMRHLTEAYQKGMNVCEEQDAAKIPFNADEIPPYEPKKYYYKVSKRWFAKEMVRIIQAMRLGTDNKDVGGSVALGKAFKRLVGFGMESIGMRKAWLAFLAIEHEAIDKEKKGQTSIEIEEWFEKKCKEQKHFMAAAYAAHKLFEKRDKVSTMIRKSPSRALRYLVLFALITMTEFDFSHEYPGADLGVYSDAFNFMGRLCLIAVKVKPGDRLAILEFGNSDDDVDDFKMMPIE